MPLKRLQILIAESGVCSRRAAEALIRNGLVRVNGEVVTVLGSKADPEVDRIEVSGVLIGKKESYRYFIFHKPLGVTTTLHDPHARKTVADYFKDIPERVFPAGRLDQNSSGLLFLTNDGDLVHALTHPRFGVEKHYVVTINKILSPEAIRSLETGIDLGGDVTAPCRIEIMSQARNKTVLSIVLHEGKKRQIRRMIEKVGGRVTKLLRNQYGPLVLGDLKPGERKELSNKEIEPLKKVMKHV